MALLPPAFWLTLAFLYGAIVGSFLNVVIWRLPRGRNLAHPGSRCPHCGHAIRAWENIPVLSFVLLRAQCSSCRKPISWRYPGVEMLTAVLFALLAWHFYASALTVVAYCLFTAALLAAFFIDLELFLIPDELNTFALFVGLGLDAVRIAQQGRSALMWGWLPHSIFGAFICAALFIAIQLLGYGLFRKEAMGDGDVKLARAIGSLLPLQQALVSFFLAVAVGAVIGVAKLAWTSMRGNAPVANTGAAAEDSEEEDEEEEPYGVGYIASSAMLYLFFVDLALQFVDFVRRVATGAKKRSIADEEDDFVATPAHIPFGPFMVLGYLLAIFVGDPLVQAYLRWTGLEK